MPKSQLNQKKTKESLNSFAKYSTLAFQMIAIILFGVIGGIKLDKYTTMEFPLFTVLFTVISVILSIYFAIKDFIKMK
ncbi:MAG: AtpZ/AtpI family protein [Bacteroidales bacterium]|nr:AtpZ/AtpI family protein [Bacteroidales bacterium]